MYNLISTGSKGNAVLYGRILVDIGVSYKAIKDLEIDIVLLTHEHGDHINISTLRKLQSEKPLLRIGCCEWMVEKLEGLNNIDVYKVGKHYDYGQFEISPIQLYHDVPNCGYRIFQDDKKIIHATDTESLTGIEAKGYDLYAIEHNYDEDKIERLIREHNEEDKFFYGAGAKNSHLSFQQAFQFIEENKKEDSETLMLHMSEITL